MNTAADQTDTAVTAMTSVCERAPSYVDTVSYVNPSNAMNECAVHGRNKKKKKTEFYTPTIVKCGNFWPFE